LAEIGDFAAKMPNLASFGLGLDYNKRLTDKGFAKFQENILASKTIKSLKLRLNNTSITEAKVKDLEKIFACKNLLV